MRCKDNALHYSQRARSHTKESALNTSCPFVSFFVEELNGVVGARFNGFKPWL